MKLLFLIFLAAAAIVNPIVKAQDAHTKPAPASESAQTNDPAQQNESAQPDPAATLQYIHGAWDTLTRSLAPPPPDCHSMADIKITADPVLYLPAETPAPPEVTNMAQQCHVRVLSLPRRIEKLGDVRPEDFARLTERITGLGAGPE